ncbi:plasmid partitioning protein RepA-8 [Roseivivax marinus]|uniref:Plasmid partitioning protein RepA-8 n=1 Tax=Roseivivax marinus TaxID=1379903 RepID=W4HH03_9RHOB|nr:plasmid partitioning protein RepA [Roseivivax marinus]ETW11411.1 plasmid partitioning protein RepA-8 [Roseivivax marinus]UMA66819.1 plasmid partitioning protein RepA [Roseivivax marinus]
MSELLLHDRIRRNAEDLSDALDSMMQSFFSPDETKILRSFSSPEVAELLGVSQGYLRKAHFENRIPNVPTGPGNKRVYTAEQIWEIRQALAAGSKRPQQLLPGRREGDRLQVWSFCNFKGGSAKTTTAIHVAQRLALRGYRVLALDADPQASLTTFFGFRPEVDFPESGTIYDAIRYTDPETRSGPVPLSDVIRKTYFHNLDLAPGGLLLAEFEHETPQALSRMEQPVFFERISHALGEIEANYDVVIVDCPPQLGYVTLSALCASTSMIMTIIPDRIDIASAAQFLKMASSLLEVLAKSGGVTQYDNLCFLLSRFDTSIATQKDLALYLRTLFGDQVMQSEFLKSSAVSDAGIAQKTIYEVAGRDMNRRTHGRLLESVNSVCTEIEGMIQKAWGREA